VDKGEISDDSENEDSYKYRRPRSRRKKKESDSSDDSYDARKKKNSKNRNKGSTAWEDDDGDDEPRSRGRGNRGRKENTSRDDGWAKKKPPNKSRQSSSAWEDESPPSSPPRKQGWSSAKPARRESPPRTRKTREYEEEEDEEEEEEEEEEDYPKRKGNATTHQKFVPRAVPLPSKSRDAPVEAPRSVQSKAPKGKDFGKAAPRRRGGDYDDYDDDGEADFEDDDRYRDGRRGYDGPRSTGRGQGNRREYGGTSRYEQRSNRPVDVTYDLDDMEGIEGDDIDEDRMDIRGHSRDSDRPYNQQESGGGLNYNSSISFVLLAHDSGGDTDHVQCVIVRDRTGIASKMSPTYRLYLENKNKLLVMAVKNQFNRTSNYHMYDMTRGQAGSKLTKKSGNYLGKLRARNVNRTEYVLITQASEREEVAAVVFDRHGIVDQLKEGSLPRKMSVMVPQLDMEGTPIANRTGDNDSGSMADMLRNNDDGNMFVFESKEPVFENGNFRLNFRGRVSVPSVKNFQLVSPDDIDHVICQFGKIGEDRYHLDFKTPLNAFQAFALALCQFNL